MKAKLCRVCTGGKCKHNGTLCVHGRVLRACKECGGNLMRARARAPQMQGVRWQGHLRAWTAALLLQGLRRRWRLRARAGSPDRNPIAVVCCEVCRCARAAADAQEKAAAALGAAAALESETAAPAPAAAPAAECRVCTFVSFC